MKIDSSQIMMGSRQVMMETTSMRESYEKTLIGGNSSANAGLGSFAGTLRATQTSMSQNSAREEDPIATIRQKSIMFLLDILFAARRGRSDRAFRNSLKINLHRWLWKMCIMSSSILIHNSIRRHFRPQEPL